jgi:DNA-binding CsgD family transcriptional regulator
VTGRARVARLTEAVEHLSATGAVNGADDRALRAQILGVIRRIVPFDAYAFLLTDPATTVGCSPLAEVPNLATLPGLIRLKYLTTVNRWAGLGILDVASVVFRDRFGCWGFLDLWRRGSRFSDDEAAGLAGALPAITALLRGVQAAGFTAPGNAPEHRGPGALVLSPALAVRAQTPQTQDWLAALVPPQSARGPVPASAYNVAAQLLATEAGVDAHAAQARVHLGGGTWLTLRADRVAGDEPAGNRDIVVTMEASSPTERRGVFSRAHGLSGREDQLLTHLAEGADTHTVAGLMSISEHTVQDHLKSVFAKTAASSRRELLARSVGQ